MGPVSVDQWTVTVSLCSDTSVAQVRIAGAIDLAAEAALAGAADQLRAAARRTVLVDVAEVTFASSTLINFLARLRKAMPPDAAVVVSGATAHIRRLLVLTGLESIIDMDEGRPAAV